MVYVAQFWFLYVQEQTISAPLDLRGEVDWSGLPAFTSAKKLVSVSRPIATQSKRSEDWQTYLLQFQPRTLFLHSGRKFGGVGALGPLRDFTDLPINTIACVCHPTMLTPQNGLQR